jgi:hypothetical protein
MTERFLASANHLSKVLCAVWQIIVAKFLHLWFADAKNLSVIRKYVFHFSVHSEIHL